MAYYTGDGDGGRINRLCIGKRRSGVSLACRNSTEGRSHPSRAETEICRS